MARMQDIDPKGVPLTANHSLTAIAASLLRVTETSDMKTIMVTSCRSGEGKTTTAVNISRALMEEAGKSILLIDGNHEAPSLHRCFSIDASMGFVDLVHGRLNVEQTLKILGPGQLKVLPYGATGPRNLDFYRSEHFKNLLDNLANHFDLIIFDGPSIFGKQDPGTIAGSFDGLILVIECEKTPWEVVQSGRKRLEEMGAHLLGAVMNRRKYYIPRGLYA